MKILAIGDVVGRNAVEYLKKNLWHQRDLLGADFVVANGENATDIYGLSASDADSLLSCGIDLITLGNHAFSQKSIFTALNDSQNVIRPANYPPMTPGTGYTVLNICGWRILGINILGTALMDSLACPFATVDRILEREKGNYDISILDIHAEATAEKVALGLYFDGKIDIIFGTHTHVQTADGRVLKKGSGYITDLGMVGAEYSVIGSDPQTVIDRMRTKISCRLTVASGSIKADGAIFDFNTDTKKVTSVTPITF